MKTLLGLIVTYNPPSDFFSSLDTFYSQLDQIILVDNGSDPESRRRLEQELLLRKQSLIVLFNETNLGIATALNQGFKWAVEQGYDYLLAFDQDSQPEPGMVQVMLDVFNSYEGDGRLAVVAPVIGDPQVKVKARYLRVKNGLFFERASCDSFILDNVTIVITSGSLYDLEVYQRIGQFRDDFFIDYVDTEYCLRANQYGYKIAVACDAYLHHRLGNRQRRMLLGRAHYPTFHSALRWYYISRNRIPMLRQYATRSLHWLLYEIIASLYTIMRMLLFETQKVVKLRALFLGTLDGIRGRLGKAPEKIIKQLER
jgi:rhamnosyltransferase